MAFNLPVSTSQVLVIETETADVQTIFSTVGSDPSPSSSPGSNSSSGSSSSPNIPIIAGAVGGGVALLLLLILALFCCCARRRRRRESAEKFHPVSGNGSEETLSSSHYFHHTKEAALARNNSQKSPSQNQNSRKKPKRATTMSDESIVAIQPPPPLLISAPIFEQFTTHPQSYAPTSSDAQEQVPLSIGASTGPLSRPAHPTDDRSLLAPTAAQTGRPWLTKRSSDVASTYSAESASVAGQNASHASGSPKSTSTASPMRHMLAPSTSPLVNTRSLATSSIASDSTIRPGHHQSTNQSMISIPVPQPASGRRGLHAPSESMASSYGVASSINPTSTRQSTASTLPPNPSHRASSRTSGISQFTTAAPFEYDAATLRSRQSTFHPQPSVDSPPMPATRPPPILNRNRSASETSQEYHLSNSQQREPLPIRQYSAESGYATAHEPGEDSSESDSKPHSSSPLRSQPRSLQGRSAHIHDWPPGVVPGPSDPASQRAYAALSNQSMSVASFVTGPPAYRSGTMPSLSSQHGGGPGAPSLAESFTSGRRHRQSSDSMLGFAV